MSPNKLAEAAVLLTGVCGIAGLNFGWEVILLTEGFLSFAQFLKARSRIVS
jgi:hypothetical protein